MVAIKKKTDMDTRRFSSGILKTTTLGYDGKGQYPIKKLKILIFLILIFPKDIYLKNHKI